MAEYLLRAELESRGCTDVEVDSSGTWASDGNPATSSATDTMGALGVDLGPHRARSFDREYAEAADIVVVMTSVHEREVLEVAPGAESKLVLLKELVEMKKALGSTDSTDAAARLKSLLAAPRPERRRALDVDDPMGLPITAYARCAGELKAGVEVLAEVLCG